MRFKIEVLLALAFGGLALIGFIQPIVGWMFLGLACFVGLDILARILRRPMRFRWPISFEKSPAVSNAQGGQDKSAESSRDQRLETEAAVLKQQVDKLTPLAYWMDHLKRYEREYPERCVHIYDRNVNFGHLREQDRDKYVEFNFHLISSSVFLLDIGVNIEGRIVYSTGKELKDEPIIREPIRDLLRGIPRILPVRQYVSDNIAVDIRKNAGTEMPLGMGGIRISVQSKALDGTAGPSWYLKIPDPLDIAIPDWVKEGA